jgi:hypothetical protein
MAEKRAVKSNRYQFVFNELTIPSELMESFGNNDSIENRLNPWIYDEKLLELEDQLKKEFWRIVDECLTDRQREVLKMLADGYTQLHKNVYMVRAKMVVRSFWEVVRKNSMPFLIKMKKLVSY